MATEDNCGICLDLIANKDWIDFSKHCCKKKIHIACIEESRRAGLLSCPYCRAIVKVSDLMKLVVNITEDSGDQEIEIIKVIEPEKSNKLEAPSEREQQYLAELEYLSRQT